MFGISVCFLICLGTTYSVEFSCMDESEKPVDWFVLYKLPQLKRNRNKLVRNGRAYAYMTSEGFQEWTLSDTSIESRGSIPGLTTDAIYGDNKKDVLYLLYNDQKPNGKTKFSGGHAKGLVVAGKDGGFWLVHSVPHFVYPPSEKGYRYPESGTRNGQSFLCITLKPDELEAVGSQLLYNQVNVYHSNVPKSLKKYYPRLLDVSAGEKPRGLNKLENIKSAGGVKFKVFSKSGKWGKELYTDWVSKELKTDLVLQTWPNGRSHQKSSCSRKGYNVENIDETKVDGVSFPSTKDHSKWAASESASRPWVCVGDINKDDSQEKRGGGTVCFENKDVWKAYYNSAVNVEYCRQKEEEKWKSLCVSNIFASYR